MTERSAGQVEGTKAPRAQGSGGKQRPARPDSEPIRLRVHFLTDRTNHEMEEGENEEVKHRGGWERPGNNCTQQHQGVEFEQRRV